MSRLFPRLFETTTTQGTGAVDLDGAQPGFEAFVDRLANGESVYYLISQSGGVDGWEEGLGTFNTGSPNTLSRDTVLKSSNADAQVDWGPGTKNVVCVAPADALADLSVVAGNESAARNNLGASSGLWPASVGGTGESDASGLGTQDAPLPPSNNLNSVVRTGWVRTDGSTSNRPASDDNFAVMTIRASGSGQRYAQIAYRVDTDLDLTLSGPWWRAGEGGSWTGWKRLPFDRATQAQAEGGTVEGVWMDPLRTAQATAVDYQKFTSSDTWDKPGKGTIAFIQIWGAGGGGAGGSNAAGGGGGGGYVDGWFPLSALSSSESVTIGAGGTGGTGAIGSPGGTSSFGSYLSAYGGGGGGRNTATCAGGGGGGIFSAGGDGENGGTTPGSAGDPSSPLSTDGGVGANKPGYALYGAGGGGAVNGSTGGDGGDSVYGGAGGGGDNSSAGSGGSSIFGGDGGDANVGGNGEDGTQPGGGGGGCAVGNGGAGGDGQVTVTVF